MDIAINTNTHMYTLSYEITRTLMITIKAFLSKPMPTKSDCDSRQLIETD